MGLVGALVVGCTGVEEDDPPETTETSELGTAATVFAVQTSVAGWGAMTIQEDRLASGPNTVTLSTTFILGSKTPGPPEVSLKYRVNAADEDTASAGGILIGLALTAGIPLQQAVDQLLLQGNIALTVDHLTGVVPPGPPQISLGKIARVADLALHGYRPGGGCILFDQGLAALGLPDGCTDDGIAQHPTNVGGAYFSLSAVGPSNTLTLTETVLAPSLASNFRFSVKYVLGVREAAVTPQTIAYTVGGDDPVVASMGGLLVGLGFIGDRSLPSTHNELFTSGMPLHIEKLTVTEPRYSQVAAGDLTNLVDGAVASGGIPGGGCILFGQGAVGLGFELGCDPDAP